MDSGSNHDPVLAAYEALPAALQELFRDLFSNNYKDDQIVLGLQYLGVELDELRVRQFRGKLAQGRVEW